MSNQKIYGLIVTGQQVPLLEKPEDSDQCFICGFSFKNEDCMTVATNEDLTDKRKVHAKCIQNHLALMPKDAKIALISVDTNEVLSYTTVSEKA